MSHATNYGKTPRLPGERARRFFGDGLTTASEAAHLRQRRMLQPVFHRSVIARFAGLIGQCGSEMAARWTDGATAEGALARFVGAPDAPMEVVIGTTTHSGGLETDPFAREPFAAARPSAGEQFGADVAFVKRVLGGEAVGRQVSYRVAKPLLLKYVRWILDGPHASSPSIRGLRRVESTSR